MADGLFEGRALRDRLENFRGPSKGEADGG